MPWDDRWRSPPCLGGSARISQSATRPIRNKLPVNTGRRTASELVAEIEKIVVDLIIVNRIGVLGPTLKRVLGELAVLDQPPTTAEIECAIDTMIKKARSMGDVLKLRRLRAWRLE
jgi:hypothetical protein